jgi:hypothetical protein
MFGSIQNCRLRTGGRIRADFRAVVLNLFEAGREGLFLLVGAQFAKLGATLYGN